MKLGNQALLAVVPLFLVIGLAGAAASWLLESHELQHGAEQQGRGMAVAIAAHLTGADWPVRDGGAADRLAWAEDRLAHWDILRGIQIWDNEGQLVHRWPDPKTIEAAAVKASRWVEEDDATKENAFAVGRLELTGNENAVVRGGAVVLDVDGTPLGWVECELDASGWLGEWEGRKWDHLEVVGGIVLLGILVALFGSRMLVADVSALLRSARQVGSGNYAAPSRIRVKELQELSETFSMVDGLMHENRLKFQRSMIENEIFRTSNVLSEVFQSEVMPPINTQIAGRRVVSRLFDKGDGSRWHGTGADGDNQQGWLWYGAVEGAPTIDTALRALNVASELESLLLRQNVSPGEALSELAPLYDLAAGWIVKWQVGVPSLEIWHWSADTGLTSRQDLPVNQRFLGHDLSGDLAATFNVVWNGSQTISVDEALAKLERFLGNTNAVVAAVVEA
jgi:hypothetical protein